MTFNEENTLQLSTELVNPTWTYIIILDGVDNPSKTEVGNNVNINGWILSYPAGRSLSLKVTLEGIAPTVTGSEEKIIVRIRELGSSGGSIASSEVVKKKLVVSSTYQPPPATSYTQSPVYAGISVRDISITPASDLVSGETRVRSTLTINFPSSGGVTFNEENTLQLSTELVNPTWTYIIILDGVDNPSKTEVGNNVNINGWILSYPAGRSLSLKVTLEGTAPTVTGSEEKIIVRIRELGSSGGSIASSEVVKKKLVVSSTYQPTSTTFYTQSPQITLSSLPDDTATSSISAQEQEIIDQLKRQNQLLEEQNKKLEEQSNLLQNLIDMWNNFLRALGVSK